MAFILSCIEHLPILHTFEHLPSNLETYTHLKESVLTTKHTTCAVPHRISGSFVTEKPSSLAKAVHGHM